MFSTKEVQVLDKALHLYTSTHSNASRQRIRADHYRKFLESLNLELSAKFFSFFGEKPRSLPWALEAARTNAICEYCGSAFKTSYFSCTSCHQDPILHSLIWSREQHTYAEERFKKKGFAWGSQSPNYLEKTKETCRERYGTDHPTQAKSTKDKARKTNLRRRGVPYPLQSAAVQRKCRRTWLRNLGVDNPSKSVRVHAKKISNSFKRVQVRTKHKVFLCQGYEPIFLKSLLRRGYSDLDIQGQCERRQSETETYGRLKSYPVPSKLYSIPDFYLVPKQLYIEVKSAFTLLKGWDGKALQTNQRKAVEAKRVGMKLAFVVVDKESEEYFVLPPDWHSWSASRVQRRVDNFMAKVRSQ